MVRRAYDGVAVSSSLVTIVTPSLNQGCFLRATIESVLRQDYPAIEYLIMDGGSTDETAAIAAEYASRLRFISEPDRGQSDAINKGFRMAKGEIVSWLNSDDVILDGAVTQAVQALESDPEAGAVYGEGYRIGEGGETLGRFPFTEPFNLWKLVHVTDYILQQTVYFRKAAVEEAGYLDESLHYTMDWDLLIRIGKRHRLVYVPKYMGAIREYPAAKSFTGGGRRLKEIRRMLRRHTGTRWPPGLILYTLETYRRWWAAPLTGRWVERIRREAQGLYRDGWVAPRLRYLPPAGEGRVSIQGVSPFAQKFAVACDGVSAGSFEIPTGDFDIRVEAKGIPLVEIQASRNFTPPSAEGGPRRRLAWVLKRIEWVG